MMEVSKDDTVSNTATGTATTIDEKQEQQKSGKKKKIGRRKSPTPLIRRKKSPTPTMKSAKESADAAWTRLYSATTAAHHAGKWNVFKRAEEEKKKKIKPKDNIFLAYGEDILSENFTRKQCAPTVPRKRPEKVYSIRNRQAKFVESSPKTPRRRPRMNKLSSSSSVASVSSNASYGSIASRYSTASAPARITRKKSVEAARKASPRRVASIETPRRISSITPRAVKKKASTTPTTRRKSPPRTKSRSTTPPKKSLTKSRSTPNNKIKKPANARRTKSNATPKKIKAETVSAEEESTIATNENDTDALLELELDAILDDDDFDDDDGKPIIDQIDDDDDTEPHDLITADREVLAAAAPIIVEVAAQKEVSQEFEVSRELKEREEVQDAPREIEVQDAPREIEIPEEAEKEVEVEAPPPPPPAAEEVIKTYIDDDNNDDVNASSNNNNTVNDNDADVLPLNDQDDNADDNALPSNDNDDDPQASSDTDVDYVSITNHDDMNNPETDVIADEDADPVGSSSFIEEIETKAGEEEEEVAEKESKEGVEEEALEEEALEEEEAEQRSAEFVEELVPNTPPPKKIPAAEEEEPPTSIGKPSGGGTTHVIPMSPLTPDIRSEKLRPVNHNSLSPENIMISTKLRSVELNNSPIPNIADILNGSNKLRRRKAGRKQEKQEPKIFGKEWLLKHWNNDESSQTTPSLLVIPERKELESLFSRIDENSSGKISMVELHTAIQILYPDTEGEEDKNKTKDASFRAALENIVIADENALELEEFSFFIHYMVYYHNLSFPFKFAISTEEDQSSFTITHYNFMMVAQDIIWSNLLILKGRDESSKAHDLFDVLSVIEENNTNEDDNKIIHFDSLCKYLAMRALRDFEEELYHERHSSDDDDDEYISSAEEEEENVANEKSNNEDDDIDASAGGLFHKFSGGTNLSMESVDENKVSLHTLDINNEESNNKKNQRKNSGVQSRMKFFEEQQKKDNANQFVNQNRRSLFKPKTWRKSFYKNQFIAKANAESKKVQDDTADD